MNLVTANRTMQNAIANFEVSLTRLTDHVEEVDDHLRGVAGRESLDTRVAILENESKAHSVLLRQISEQFGSLQTMISTQLTDIRNDLQTIKIHRAITKEVSQTKVEILREWLKFWGPIILLILTGIGAWLKGPPKFITDYFRENPDETALERIKKSGAQPSPALRKLKSGGQHGGTPS